MIDTGQFRVAVLAISDCLTLYGVWAAVVLGYHFTGLGHYQPEFYLCMWPMGPAFVGLNYLFRLYHGSVLHPAAPISPVEELRRLVGSAMLTHIGVIAALALIRQTTEDFSRVVMVASGVLVALLAQPVRDIARRVMFALGVGRIPVVVAGSSAAVEQVKHTLETDDYLGFRVERCFDERQLRKVVRKSQTRNVRILVACLDVRLFQCQMEEYSQWFTHIEYLPTSKAFPVLGARAISFGGLGGLEMVNQRMMGVLRFEKWLLDKTLALLAFLALLPFFVVVPLLIKLTSRGPVFFRQERLGKDGRKIKVWKFRSMYVDAESRLERLFAENPSRKAEWKAAFKLRDDPRVTPLGRFLRKTSIDEFPQLFNVLAGEMALIGPRPIVQEEVHYYGDSYRIFSSVKPGVTGLWQVSGRSDTDYGRRVALDTYYVLNWSPWLDVWILFRSVPAVLFMRGAC